MDKRLKFAVASFASLLFLSAPFALQTRTLCDGFLPPNDMKIPVGSALGEKGLKEQQFNQVIDLVESVYRPIIAAKGGELEIQRLWTDDTVNAMATRRGNKYVLKMFGGLARHEVVTQDGFAVVACHEMGHHLGGAPKMSKLGGTWASNEGQSDYFGNLKCLRKIFLNPGTASFTRTKSSDPIAEKACASSFKDPKEQAVCLRGAMAGMSVSMLFKVMRKEPNPPRFDTPDQAAVARTDDRHPGTQCRLDTYYQGAICPKSFSEDVSDNDPARGTCTRSGGFSTGIRPLCWYKPPVSEQLPSIADLNVKFEAMQRVLSSNAF